MGVAPYPKEGKIAQAADILGRPYIIIRINDVIYRIRRHSRGKMVFHLNRLAPYLETTQVEYS